MSKQTIENPNAAAISFFTQPRKPETGSLGMANRPNKHHSDKVNNGFPQVTRRPSASEEQSEFYSWLMLQRYRDDPIGELAGDVAFDPGWPKSACSWSELERALPLTACSGARAALKTAWKEWSNTCSTLVLIPGTTERYRLQVQEGRTYSLLSIELFTTGYLFRKGAEGLEKFVAEYKNYIEM
jgi:uncharacterized protein YozE (UPF0346 family)